MTVPAEQPLVADGAESPEVSTVNRGVLLANLASKPAFRASQAISSWSEPRSGELDTVAVHAGLHAVVQRVVNSDMAPADEMLVGQAMTLDVLFHELLRRAGANMGEHPEAFERYMRLALKAQSQARSTWESLSRIKNPPQATFIRQANVANGPQQVNNGLAGDASGERKIENQQNELLEAAHGQRMDPRAQATSCPRHSPLEAVGAVYRPQDGRG